MIYLIISTICFSLSFGLIKSQLSSLPSEFVAFCRLLFAMIVFLPFFRIVDIKKVGLSLLIGVFQFGLMYFCFIKAFKFLQGNEVALLTTTTPVFVAIWSSLFGERFKFIYIVCILMSVLGAGIVVWQNLEFKFIVQGVLLMETSNCCFALGQVLWKKFIGNEHGTNLMSSAYFGAMLFIFPFVLLNNDFNNVQISTAQFWSIVYLSIVPTGLGFWLWNKGSTLVKCSTLAIMNNFKIPLGVFFSLILFHEKINLGSFLLGSSVILISVLLLDYFTKKDDINI